MTLVLSPFCSLYGRSSILLIEIKQHGIMYNFHGVCLKMLLLVFVMENYYMQSFILIDINLA